MWKRKVLAFIGFTFNPEHEDSLLEGAIAGDGSLVLKFSIRGIFIK